MSPEQERRFLLVACIGTMMGVLLTTIGSHVPWFPQPVTEGVCQVASLEIHEVGFLESRNCTYCQPLPKSCCDTRGTHSRQVDTTLTAHLLVWFNCSRLVYSGQVENLNKSVCGLSPTGQPSPIFSTFVRTARHDSDRMIAWRGEEIVIP